MTLGRSETGMDNSIIPKVGNGKRMEKKHSQNSGAGRERKKIPQIQEWEGNEKIYSQTREREGNEKKAFPKFGNTRGMTKSIPTIREQESEAFILGNGWEREFPLTPGKALPSHGSAQNLLLHIFSFWTKS